MKKILLSLTLGIILTFNAQAQVDFGFELPWQGIGGNPQGWASAKILYPNIVAKDSIIYHWGSKSARITTTDVSLISGQTGGLLPPTSGVMLTGVISIGGANPVQLGYPFSQRKDSLGFFARYQPVGTDTAFAQVIFYKRTTNRDTIAMGLTKISSTNGNFDLFYVEMVYDQNFPNTTIPDSALIIFSSSLTTGAQIGSTLWVDDLKWGTINTGIIEAPKAEELQVLPNPADEYITLNLGLVSGATLVELTDIEGKLIERLVVNSKLETIGVGHLADGMYLYTVKNQYNSVLKSGKFAVKH